MWGTGTAYRALLWLFIDCYPYTCRFLCRWRGSDCCWLRLTNVPLRLMKLVVSKQQVKKFYPTSSINFYVATNFFVLWCTILIFCFGPGGLGADPDRDTSVRGTVSLCSLSLGLKKVHILALVTVAIVFLQYRIGLNRGKKAFCFCIHTWLHDCGPDPFLFLSWSGADIYVKSGTHKSFCFLMITEINYDKLISSVIY